MKRKLTTLGVCLPILTFIFLVASCGKSTDTENGEQNGAEGEVTVGEEPTQIASPRKQAEGQIAGVQVVVDYGSPAVKDREIWGGLEPYGEVWRAGANETTSIEFSEDVMIGGTEVKKGKYGFYLIPNEASDWIAIINTDWNREEHGAWGAYNYTEKNDITRAEVSPDWGDNVKERLEYKVEGDGIVMAWEKVTLKIPVSVSTE